MRKNIIIITSCVLAVMILGVGGYLIYSNNTKIASTIILDINPSVKINLNKKEKVLSVIPLNDDAKDIVSNDLKGKKLDVVVENITEKVIEKEYLILTDSVTGEIIEETYTLTPQPKYSEEEEANILLRYNNVLKEDTTTIYPSYGKDRDGYANGATYRHSSSINMKDGTRYNGSVNAMTGEVYNTRTEKY